MDDKLIILNKLMNGELVAHWQYEIAAKTCIGENQSYLVEQFEEHAKDEYDHYGKLMTAFLQRGGKPNLNLVDAVRDALPITDELKSNLSEYLRKFFHKAEESAIKAYESYLELLGDSDPDLADIVTGIISDERDHDLDMERLVTKDNPNVVKNFSESSKEVKVDDLKTGDIIWVKGYGKVKVTSIQNHGGNRLINFIDKDGSEDTVSKDCNQTVKVYGDKNMKDIKKDINFAENVLGFASEASKLTTFPNMEEAWYIIDNKGVSVLRKKYHTKEAAERSLNRYKELLPGRCNDLKVSNKFPYYQRIITLDDMLDSKSKEFSTKGSFGARGSQVDVPYKVTARLSKFDMNGPGSNFRDYTHNKSVIASFKKVIGKNKYALSFTEGTGYFGLLFGNESDLRKLEKGKFFFMSVPGTDDEYTDKVAYICNNGLIKISDYEDKLHELIENDQFFHLVSIKSL